MDHQFVVPRLQIDEFKSSVAIRGGIPLSVVVQVRECDLGTGDRSFAGILYHTNDTPKR
jgi:hypothetical protein